MICKEWIIYDGIKGYIEYDTDDIPNFKVVHPNEAKRKEVVEYFKTERDYLVPMSDQIDDVKEIRAKPTDEEFYFRAALVEIWHRLDVKRFNNGR